MGPKSVGQQGPFPPEALEKFSLAAFSFSWLPACLGLWPHHLNVHFSSHTTSFSSVLTIPIILHISVFVITFRAYPDNPGKSLHLKIPYHTSKVSLPLNVTFMGSSDKDFDILGDIFQSAIINSLAPKDSHPSPWKICSSYPNIPKSLNPL